MTKAILVPVDGSDSSTRAVKFAIEAVKGAPDTRLLILSVQPPIVSGNVKRFFSADAIHGYYEDAGQNALAPAKAILDEAGVPYEAHVEVGPIGHTIADFAGHHGCSHIIMGTRGLGTVTGLVLGSITTKVLSLATVPVTLIK